MRRTISRSRDAARGTLRGSPQLRLRFGFLVIAMVLSVFGARLVQLQGVDPNAYAAMAAAEGTVTLDLPAERGDILDRNGRPLADSVDGEMVVADPFVTRAKAPELAKFLASRLDIDYFETLEGAAPEGQAVRLHRAPGAGQQGGGRRGRGRGGGLRGARHPSRPDPRLPRRRRGRQPGRLRRHRRGARRIREQLRPAPGRHRRLRALRRRRRQPDPARPGHHRAAGRRPGPPDHDRPRPAVVHPAGPAADGRGRPRRLRLRGRDGHQDRRGARPGRPPDVRRPQRPRRPTPRTACPGR